MHAFGNKQVLSDVYITLKTGETVGLLGRNGSGKTTLLNIIFGILKPDCISIHLDGSFCERLYTKKNLITFLPPHNFLPARLTVEKAITLFLEISVDTNILSEDRIVNPLLKKKIWTLSGGELRYLEIMLILESDSIFTLLDEPFRGQAPIYQEKIQDKIRKTGKGKGVIVTDHYYNAILDISDRIVLLDKGTTVAITDHRILTDYKYMPAVDS